MLRTAGTESPARCRRAAGWPPRSELYWPLCVICTTLSRTVILPVRGDAPGFAATVNLTGLSPACGIEVVIVIHGTSASAVQRQAFCSGPPQVFGSLACTTLNSLFPPAAATLILGVLTA